MNISKLFLALALLLSWGARADIILSTPHAQVVSGTPVQLDLTITNSDAQPLVVELPVELHVRFETPTALSVIEFTPERTGKIEVAPGGFVRMKLQGALPAQVEGVATLVPTGLASNSVALQILPPAQNSNAVAANESTRPAEPQQPKDSYTTALVDKPPPLAVSVYEPVYFLVGGDGGLNAKFQISLRYQLFDGRGPLARRLPWIDDLYLSYSQTSLWDLGDLSKPFKDSSYRPRLFFSNYDLARFFDGQLRVGVETGFGHESNGKEGDDSRSFNMFYARPTLTLGDPSGLRFFAAPLIHNYIADDENPDLKDYRGYVDWVLGIGAKGGLDFWTTIRKGERSDYGSVELNVSYPLSKLSGGDLTGWLTLQYFNGYGESLLDYNRKLDSQWRLGIAVAL
ncbi:phospholipase A [Steroidobacter sp.]|uniref:phospholipase A n=1 Tax=Steroidobacter sp. TaxID=1978227 RepID=UPI001A545275|nr:phospholipase A [Steroidobacter sp.]MBL8267104.1 phospholipase A [Steroidobacter sp.]